MFRKNLSIRKYLIWQLFIIWLCVGVVFFVISGVFIFRTIVSETEIDFTKRLNLMREQLNSHLNIMIDQTSYIVGNSRITAGMKYDYSNDMSKMLEFNNYLNDITTSTRNLNLDFSCEIIIYTPNTTLPVTQCVRHSDEIVNEEIKRIVNDVAKDKLTWCVTQEEITYLSLFRNIYFTNSYVGCAEVRVPINATNRIVETAQIADGEFIRYYDENACYFSTDGMRQGRTVVNIENELLNGQIIALSCSRGFIFRKFFPYLLFIIVLLAFVTLAVYSLIKAFIKHTTEELYEFIDQIEQGSYNSDVTTSDYFSYSEIGAIKRRFYEILEERDRMLKNVVELEKKRKALEMEILQLQINPHLLYNSLSTVNWKLLERGDRQMSSLINRLTKYYRISLSSGSMFIPLEKEIELIENYLCIMEICKNMKIELSVDASQEVLKYQVFKLMLQPIVENSVLHGFCHAENPRISIKVREYFDRIEITVSDNGVGIDERILQNLEQYRTKGETDAVYGYGLKNCISRIKLYYGEEYGLSVMSGQGKGTTVLVSIGKIISDETNGKEKS